MPNFIARAPEIGKSWQFECAYEDAISTAYRLAREAFGPNLKGWYHPDNLRVALARQAVNMEPNTELGIDCAARLMAGERLLKSHHEWEGWFLLPEVTRPALPSLRKMFDWTSPIASIADYRVAKKTYAIESTEVERLNADRLTRLIITLAPVGLYSRWPNTEQSDRWSKMDESERESHGSSLAQLAELEKR